MDKKVEIKLDNEWIELTNPVGPNPLAYIRAEDDPYIDYILMNSDKKYVPDTFDFVLVEEVRPDSRIERILNYSNTIPVRVFEKDKLIFYGFLEIGNEKEIYHNYQLLKLKANDYCQILDEPSNRYWKFINISLADIATSICNNVSPEIAARSYWPTTMHNRRIPYFFATNREDTILDILDNFLYEYGYVLNTRYINNVPVVSAYSYWDRDVNTPIVIDDGDIQGDVELNNEEAEILRSEDEKKQVTLYKTNYRIVKGLKDILFWIDSITGSTEIPAGGFYPEAGDTNIQHQNYTVFHKDNFESVPQWFNPNSKLDWGTVSKRAEIVYAFNQRFGWYHVAGGQPFTFIEEHEPTRSRIVIGNKAIGTYYGDEYRVTGSRRVRKIPPGCTLGSSQGTWNDYSFYYTAEFFPTKADAVEASAYENDREKRCTGDSEWVREPIIETRGVLKAREPARISWIFIRGDAYVSVGYGSAYAGIFPEDQTRQFTINNISVGDSTDVTGLPIKIMNYQFVDTPGINNLLNGWTMLTENGTMAKVGRYIGRRDPILGEDPDLEPTTDGIVQFKFIEDSFPVTWKKRNRLTSDPIPIYDKRGTKAVFISPGAEIGEPVEEETSFLYTHEDASNFVQGVFNDAASGNVEYKYDGYVVDLLGSKIHPKVGSIIYLNIPKYGTNNDRFLVTRYKLLLDEIENPVAEITVRRVKKFEEGKTYPDLRTFFPDLALAQWDPPPTTDRLYAYTTSGGLLFNQLPDPKKAYGQQGARGNIYWYNNRSEWHNRQNREIT